MSPFDNQTPQANQPSQKMQSLLAERDSLRQKLEHAWSNNGEGYWLDTDKDGAKTMGQQGYGAMERDKARKAELDLEIYRQENLDNREGEEIRRAVNQSKVLREKVLKDFIAAEDKSLHAEITKQYNLAVDRTDFTSPQLRTEDAQKQVMGYIFDRIAGELRRAARSKKPTGPNGSLDDGLAEPTDEEFDEAGNKKGSIAYELLAKYKGGRGARGTLAGK